MPTIKITFYLDFLWCVGINTEEFLHWILARYQKYNFGLYAVIDRQDRRLIGFCGLLVWNFEEHIEIEIAYRLARAYWGKGKGTEAAITVRDYARNKLGIERLICLIESTNIRSIRVAQKLGMDYEKNLILQGLNVIIYSSKKERSSKVRQLLMSKTFRFF